MGRKIFYYTLLFAAIFYFSYSIGNKRSKLEWNSSNKVTGIQNSQSSMPEEKVKEENKEKTDDPINEHINEQVNRKEVFKEVFEVKNITSEVKEKIVGNSWREGAPVKIEELRHVTVSHWGFDDKPHLGELIINEKVAQDVIDIFSELYKAEYPIEKIRLIDEYGASDEVSMKDNNTYSFCYREKTSSKNLSKHSFGLAIDINPIQNPYKKGNSILPDSGKEFLDRTQSSMGMIKAGDVCYKAFKSRGWTWGGEWTTLKDYQHFEKEIKN